MSHLSALLLLLLTTSCFAGFYELSKEELKKHIGTPHEGIALKAYQSNHFAGRGFSSNLQRRGAPLAGPEALFDAQANLRALYDLEPQFGESPCIRGFASASEGICDGFVRTYPDVGGNITFDPDTSYELAYAGSLINLWTDNLTNVSSEAIELMILGIRVAENTDEIPAFIPQGPFGNGGKSMVEALCATQGPFPFHLTCSPKYNIRLTECGFANAFVEGFDIWGGTDFAITNQARQDNLLSYCTELVLEEPEPTAIANILVHEISHGIQFGTGWTQNLIFMEGGATFAESALLGLPSRSWNAPSGFETWGDVFDAHFLSGSGSFGRFYNRLQLFLDFLSSEARLGERVMGLAQIMQVFNPGTGFVGPYGRELFDFFLQDGDFDDFVAPSPHHNNFVAAVADFWTAVYGRCSDRPTPRPDLAIPFTGQGWIINCASLGNVASSEQFYEASHNLQFGAVAAVRIDQPKDLTISPSSLEATMVRVIAISEDIDTPYEVFSVDSGSTNDLCLTGSYSSVIILTINVDPFGDLVTVDNVPVGWHLTDIEAVSGNSWYVGEDESQLYLSVQERGLQTPPVDIPEGASTFSFETLYDIEIFGSEPFPAGGCILAAWDGFLVRVFDESGAAHYPTPIVGDYANGTAYAAIESLLWDPLGTGGCPSVWTDSTNGLWETKSFDVSSFAGQSIIVEILFLSDTAFVDRGVFVDNVIITGPSGQIFIDDGDDNVFLTQVNYGDDTSLLDLSTTVEWQGRPAGFVPFDGNFADRKLIKETFIQAANWTATWRGNRRADFTWIGSGQSLGPNWITLYPGQEAVLKQEAPFDGKISTVSVLMGRYQAGIRGYRATIRSKRGDLLASETLLEPATYSNFGKTDPVQTFHFTSSPEFDCGDKFYLGFEVLFDEAALAARADYHPFGGFATVASNEGAPELQGVLDSETGSITMDPFSGLSIAISAAFSD